MKSYRTVAIVSTLAVASVFLLGVSDAFAQTVGLQIRPAVVEDRATPGQTYLFSLKVTNLNDAQQTFYLGTQDISGLDASGNPIFSDVQTPTQFELSSWIKLPFEAVTLEPNETKVLDFRLQVPGNASPGSHFGSVFFSVQPPGAGTNSTVIGYKVGAVISLRIAGDVVEDAQLREFSTDKLVYGSPHVIFRAKVENLGNDLLRPHGVIQITDMWGKQRTMTINDTGEPIFPTQDRTFTTSWTGDGFSFGRYQAVLSMSYGDDSKKTISSITSFWILPFKPIIYTLGSLLFIILVLYVFIRGYIRKKLRDMGVDSSRADPVLQAQRYSKPISRATTVMFAVLIFSIAFLLILLYLLA